MRQFKIERSDRRFKVSVPVKLQVFDANGHAVEQEVMAVDVSRRGAHLSGVRGKLQVNEVVSLARSQKVEQFLVAWVGEERTTRADSIGVSAVEADSTFWNDVIERESQNELAGVGGKHSQKLSTQANTTINRV